MVEEYFSAIPKGGDIPRPNITEPPLGGEVRDVIEDNIQLPGVIQAYRAPAQGTDEYYAFNVLTILNMVLSLLPMVFIDIYGLIKYKWGDQFYIMMIETLRKDCKIRED